jgi:hypothetical protein
MPGITSWAEALSDPRFWACYFGLTEDVSIPIFGLFERDIRAFLYELMGCADHPELLDSDEAYELVDGSVIRLSFPEDFNWTISMGPEGDLHVIDHPTVYPSGQLIAEVSGNEQLPGLRWPEALQIARCLREHWVADFPVDIVLPLLTRVIGLSPDDVLGEVHDTLTVAWRTLGVTLPGQLERWIQYIEHGLLQRDALASWEWRPETGWTNPMPFSPRNRGSLLFAPFFTMLDRYASETSLGGA